MSDVETQLEELKLHLCAYDKSTLDQSMTQFKPPTSEDSALSKIFEVLFFQKPMKLLKLLMKNADVTKWCQLPR